MTDLSPEAQAVLDAYGNELLRPGPSISGRHPLAAALQAAADQMSSYQSKKFLYSIADSMKLRDIAAELEGGND